MKDRNEGILHGFTYRMCMPQEIYRCPFPSGLRPEDEIVGSELKLSRKVILSRACFIAAVGALEYFVKIFVVE